MTGKKSNVREALDSIKINMQMPLLTKLPRGGEKYMEEIERNISDVKYGEHYMSFRLDPAFFGNEEAARLFPRMAKNFRNLSSKHVDVYCGEYTLEIDGWSCCGGGVIYKKGDGTIFLNTGEEGQNSYQAAQKFVEYCHPTFVNKIVKAEKSMKGFLENSLGIQL